jgi:hypothetical protein
MIFSPESCCQRLTGGEFDGTKPTTVRLQTDENVNVEQGSHLYSELCKLKELPDDGILSDAEYEELKQRAIRET